MEMGRSGLLIDLGRPPISNFPAELEGAITSYFAREVT